eukprot:6179461-Pleurochrysis_carterae.AAC.3
MSGGRTHSHARTRMRTLTHEGTGTGTGIRIHAHAHAHMHARLAHALACLPLALACLPLAPAFAPEHKHTPAPLPMHRHAAAAAYRHARAYVREHKQRGRTYARSRIGKKRLVRLLQSGSRSPQIHTNTTKTGGKGWRRRGERDQGTGEGGHSRAARAQLLEECERRGVARRGEERTAPSSGTAKKSSQQRERRPRILLEPTPLRMRRRRLETGLVKTHASCVGTRASACRSPYLEPERTRPSMSGMLS